MISSTVLIMLMLLPLSARATTYTVGVKPGDWIKYGHYSVNYIGNGTEPPAVTEAKEIQWMRIDIENVTGMVVFLNLTAHFNNGTETQRNYNINVYSGAYPLYDFFVIPANLTVGDAMNYGMFSQTINATDAGRYAGATRNIVVVNDTITTSGNMTLTNRDCWDQTTGVLVESCAKLPLSNATSIEESMSATETNMWNSDSTGTLASGPFITIVVSIVVIVAVVGGILIMRRRKARSTSTSEPPANPPSAPAPPPS